MKSCILVTVYLSLPTYFNHQSRLLTISQSFIDYCIVIIFILIIIIIIIIMRRSSANQYSIYPTLLLVYLSSICPRQPRRRIWCKILCEQYCIRSSYLTKTSAAAGWPHSPVRLRLRLRLGKHHSFIYFASSSCVAKVIFEGRSSMSGLVVSSA